MTKKEKKLYDLWKNITKKNNISIYASSEKKTFLVSRYIVELHFWLEVRMQEVFIASPSERSAFSDLQEILSTYRKFHPELLNYFIKFISVNKYD